MADCESIVNTAPKFPNYDLTKIKLPRYSICAKIFGLTRRSTIKQKAQQMGIDYDDRKEESFPRVGKQNNWVNHEKNQNAIYDFFYKNVHANESLCLIYSKDAPFLSEEAKQNGQRVVVGIGLIAKGVKRPTLYTINNDYKGDVPPSRVWETPIEHTIRPDLSEGVGFVIPYAEIMEYAAKNPKFDINKAIVLTPRNKSREFSNATEHVSTETAIKVLKRALKVLQIIEKEHIGGNWSKQIEWLTSRILMLWQERGTYPGLGATLCAFGCPHGILVANEIGQHESAKDIKLDEILDNLFTNPADVLSKEYTNQITPTLKKRWSDIEAFEKEFFILMSHMSLTLEQANFLWKNLNDNAKKEILDNPYLIYSYTRRIIIEKIKSSVREVWASKESGRQNTKTKETYVQVETVDAMMYPQNSVRLYEGWEIEDPRRIRAYAEYILEDRARNEGDTLVAAGKLGMLIGESSGIIAEPCQPIEKEIDDSDFYFLTGYNGIRYAKLRRLDDFDEIIREEVERRCKNGIDTHIDWRPLFREATNEKNPTGRKRNAEIEKIDILDRMLSSSIFVLTGGAGTGKTTLLSVFAKAEGIRDSVVLLAPTGKARVRLQQMAGPHCGEALTVFQYLCKYKACEYGSFEYKILNKDADLPPLHEKTIIIDECSMLTEEAMGALLRVIHNAKRIILVGDQCQLPPIGPGKPFNDMLEYMRLHHSSCYGMLKTKMRAEEVDSAAEKLSEVFRKDSDSSDLRIISQIASNNTDNTVECHQYHDDNDLEEKLMNIITSSAINFKEGRLEFTSSEQVDQWQILSPVYGHSYGVDNINMLIQEKLRKENTSGFALHDKVINIINRENDFYSVGENCGVNYVANGEIGYVKRKNIGYTNVEFSSQKGCTHGYKPSELDYLQLAYALSVHKAQGSEFKAVIVVLPPPSCRILSRELLYTAFTRHTENLVILSPSPLEEYYIYTRDEYSEVSKRLTDLFQHPSNDT